MKTIAHRVWIALFCGLASALPLSDAFAQSELVEREVPFLTVRERVSADEPGLVFGDSRSILRAGWCDIEVVDAGSLAPVLDAGPAFIREQLLRITRVRLAEPRVLLNSLQDGAPTSLYVHGYSIDFEKGCRRAALMGENASLNESLLWFTWPSDGDIANYPRDEADLYWSVPDLADAIIELHRRAGPNQRINVLGHSLGARGVVLALREVAYRAPGTRLGNVVLLAPDMDFGIFARVAPQISEIAENITVYVSSNDRPLALSAQLHGYKRLGQADNDFRVLSDVEIIDVSDLPSVSSSGHLYHIHSQPVGDDLDRLLNDGMQAGQRPNLVPTGPNVWSLRP